MRPRSEAGDDFIAFRKALEAMTGRIISAAAETVGDILWIQILDWGRVGCIHGESDP